MKLTFEPNLIQGALEFFLIQLLLCELPFHCRVAGIGDTSRTENAISSPFD